MLDFSTQQTLDPIALTADAQAAKAINDRHREVVRLGRAAKDIAAEIGEGLIEVKARLEHGEFIPWCETNLTFGKTQRQRYMLVAQIKKSGDGLFQAANSIEELTDKKKPKPTPKVERRAATLDDLRKVERLQALTDDAGAPVGERQAAQAMLDKIEAEIGPVEPKVDYSKMSTVELSTTLTKSALKKARKNEKVFQLIEEAMRKTYGYTDQNLARLIKKLDTL